jgi:hypothetical protein
MIRGGKGEERMKRVEIRVSKGSVISTKDRSAESTDFLDRISFCSSHREVSSV